MTSTHDEGLGGLKSVSFSIRPSFSIQHIMSAAFFARRAMEMERESKDPYADNSPAHHWAFVTGSIISSACFLEATINELYSDTAEQHQTITQDIPADVRNRMASLWRLDVPRTASFRILQKYQIALALAQKNEFDLGSSPYQDANIVVQLRNDLVHYEPQWIKYPSSDDFRPEDIHKYEKYLRGKFALNPFIAEGNPFYPDKCLGHGCAEWSVKSSIAFTDEFCLRMGFKPAYEHARDRLLTR